MCSLLPKSSLFFISNCLHANYFMYNFTFKLSGVHVLPVKDIKILNLNVMYSLFLFHAVRSIKFYGPFLLTKSCLSCLWVL